MREMDTIGRYLKRTREGRAMSTEEVARATRIPIASIERIEADHFDDLPGEVFVRAARKSSERFAAIEPMHQLRISYELRGAETGALVEAAIERPRLALTKDLARLEAAGHALRWVRKAAPPLTPEPALWSTIV